MRKNLLALFGGAMLVAIPTTVLAQISETPALESVSVPISDRLPISSAQTLDPPNASAQVNSVSQLRDVQPGDWAFEALRALVERYGCLEGYPDRTYRGDRALTRYEFAAGLNACINALERTIANSEAVLKEDILTLKRLSEEFEAELAAIAARVDNLEGRVSFLEDRAFSTTTKLTGQVIFAIVGATGGDTDDSDGITGDDAQFILVDRVRLNLVTSFTGRDLLITGLQAQNFGGDITGAGSVQGTLFPNEALLTAGSTKLNFEAQFPRFNPQTAESIDSNDLEVYKLLYIFPSGLDQFTLFVGTAAETSDAFPTIIPYADEGQGAISRFAALNPVLRQSGGTSQRGLASVAGFIWGIADGVDWRALYASVNAALPEESDNALLGAGVFSGSFMVATQLTLSPAKNFDLGLNYAYSYHELDIIATGLNSFSATPLLIPGRTVNGDGTLDVGGVLDTPVTIHSLGTTFNWRFTPKLAWTGYGAYFFVSDATDSLDASSQFLSWMTGLSLSDLFREGNTAGIIFGQPLYRVDSGGDALLARPGVDREIPLHLELFYNYRFTDNISLTPGFFILFNPEGNADNDTTLVGVLRTTFTF